MSLSVVIAFQFIDYQFHFKQPTKLNFQNEIMEGVVYAYLTKKIFVEVILMITFIFYLYQIIHFRGVIKKLEIMD
jgi:hypothetical protein